MENEEDFEETVRRYARLLWSDAALAGSKLIDNRERDGYFETKESIFIIESTTSKKKEKIEYDGRKTHESILKIRGNTFKSVAGWIITKNEPTAEQKLVAEKFPTVRLLSFDQFRGLLFNGENYLRARENYPFGSVLDIKNNNSKINDDIYVPLDIIIDGNLFSTSEPAQLFEQNKRIIVLGEYGSGKSMTLRYMFKKWAERYRKNQDFRLPIYLNLRDHFGQKKPVQALEHHAREIGYPGTPSDLVRAWRAGLCHLILDGFDELGTTGWGATLKKVQAHREISMTLVRNFISETPGEVNLVLSGRENFFNNDRERDVALGIKNFSIGQLAELSSEQTKNLLRKYNYFQEPPEWLPSRPLLISYLAAENLLPYADNPNDRTSAAVGWNRLLEIISQREANQDDRLDSASVRQIIERLATIARNTSEGRGRLDVDLIQNVFKEITGLSPDETAQQFLLRLPGLSPTAADDTARAFVDIEFCDAARAGDILRFLHDPHNTNWSFLTDVQSSTGPLCKEIVAKQIQDYSTTVRQIINSIKNASDSGFNQISLDLYNGLIRAFDRDVNDAITIHNAYDDEITIYPGNCSTPNVTFSSCVFSVLNYELGQPSENIPLFNNCEVGQLIGILTQNDLPEKMKSLVVGEFIDEVTTNSDVFSSDIPPGLKALNSCLRKLFLQSGAGRQEAAFYRGSVPTDVRLAMPHILRLIQKYNFASEDKRRGREIWVPNWKMSDKARKIISAPSSSSEPIAKEARAL